MSPLNHIDKDWLFTSSSVQISKSPSQGLIRDWRRRFFCHIKKAVDPENIQINGLVTSTKKNHLELRYAIYV